jgi:AmmeMemoRadiSam system protein A
MSQPVTLQLAEADQQLLLQIARNAVQAYLNGQQPPLPDPPPERLMESLGIFVSVHKGRELRGCIGNILATNPLYRSTAECAIAAAVGDPRFMPLTQKELTDVDFEISLLSRPEYVQDVKNIEVGKHGLLISKNSGRGLLLPQVASERGWSRERFLEETCKKAGLRSDDWKEDATIQCFTALVFKEKQSHLTATQ